MARFVDAEGLGAIETPRQRAQPAVERSFPRAYLLGSYRIAAFPERNSCRPLPGSCLSC